MKMTRYEKETITNFNAEEKMAREIVLGRSGRCENIVIQGQNIITCVHLKK